MSKDNGGPAFPKTGNFGADAPGEYDSIDQDGMTLRVYIATEAMKALMPVYWDTLSEYASADEMMRCHVESAYEYADLMIAHGAKL